MSGPISSWRRVHKSLRYILDHPLGRQDRLGALRRYVTFQLVHRLHPGLAVYRFVDGVQFLATLGTSGIVGNVYVGLNDYEEMSFLLHFLRSGDTFVDVGANVGAYTLLAAGCRGARSVAMEPLAAAYRHLVRNVGLNDLGDRVNALNIGVGASAGRLAFTAELDCLNHVVAPGSLASGPGVEVETRTLDQVLDGMEPNLAKIDVEGFEYHVLAGARNTLQQESLKAIITELNGQGRAYGHGDDEVNQVLLDHGFRPMAYVPTDRRLCDAASYNRAGNNTLYVRDPEFVQQRLRDARAFRVLGRSL